MNIRHQIFVSSTYKDLKEQRKIIIDELNKVGYIAIGMEQFPASDEEQMEFIKPVIDESDYYIVILKGKYGSLAEDGLSYTEKEFEYAKASGKPTLAFIYKDYDQLTVKEIETDTQIQERFKKFKSGLLAKKIVRFWGDDNELIGAVKDSLTDAVRRRPAVGWVRGDNAIDPKIFAQLEDLRAENNKLKDALSASVIISSENLSKGSDVVRFKVRISEILVDERPPRSVQRDDLDIETTWDEILHELTEVIYYEQSEYVIASEYASIRARKFGAAPHMSFGLDDNIIQRIRYQFEALGIIQTYTREGGHTGPQLVWKFSEGGKRYVATVNAETRKASRK